MTALQLRPSMLQQRAWTPAQATRARTRMALACRQQLLVCHGLWAIELSAEPLPKEALRIPHCYRFNESFRADVRAWPIQPASIDLVIWRVTSADMVDAPAVLTQIASVLGPSARLLIWAESPALNSWCQIGMPLCLGHDWVLCDSAWGDSRAFSLFRPGLSKRWSAHWQQWLPFGAEWSVQLWQRETICPSSPTRQRRLKTSASPTLGWQPRSTWDQSSK